MLKRNEVIGLITDREFGSTGVTTTITAVVCMMRNALVLENGMPIRFVCQKYSVARIAKPTANNGGGTLKNDR